MELWLSVTLLIISIRFITAKQCDKSGCDQQKISISKCCLPGQSFHEENNTCIESAHEFETVVYDDSGNRVNSDMLILRYQYFDCEMEDYNVFFASQYKGKHHVRTDGKLVITSEYLKVPVVLSPEQYCIDIFVTEDNATRDAVICLQNDHRIIQKRNYLLTSSCMLVSCVFILLTLTVYHCLPQLYTVHGRVLVMYLMCLFVGFMLLAIMQLIAHYGINAPHFCLVTTFILYFALLSAFCWLNVMCYDIWRVFSGKRELRRNKRSVRTQMFRYAVYSFGLPTILTILVICLEFAALPDSKWRPNIRTSEGCFMSGNSTLLYMYGPLSVQCVTNILFFVLTTVKIIKTRKETSVLNSAENSRNDRQKNKQMLILHVKLFVIMGISWILEVISSLWKNENWIICDIYNTFIGFFIFIIFVCKRETFKVLEKRYRGARQCTQKEKSQTTETSKSSQCETGRKV